jgi:hypothetical protein
LSSSSLYRRVLGPRFDALPEVLRRFHDAPGGGRARGTLRVERARGWLRNGLASLFRMPRDGTDVPVRLRVMIEGDRERWVRDFQGRRLESVQWAWGGLLMEKFGPVSFSCELVVDGPCLRYEFRRAWLAGILLPRPLAPFVDGSVQAGDGGWNVGVRVLAPWLGEIVRYGGWIEPE